MSELAEIFTVLLFGEGFWFGFVIMAAFAIGLSFKYKFVGVVFEFVMFFLALEYLDNLEGSSTHLWGAVFCFILMIFIGWKIYDDATTG